MAFVDHDFHIHSYLSPCAGAEGVTQTAENILKYAEENGFNTICVTDHYWDETVPSRVGMWRRENTAWIRSILPLPQSERVRFLFGCEADMDIDDVIGVAPEHYADFDFVIIPTNHLHLSGQTCRGDEGMEERAHLWCRRFDHVLEQKNIPFQKIGIAHLTDTGIMGGTGYLDVLNYIPDEEYIRLFRKAADRGVGIELNFRWTRITDEETAIHLRPYRIAKEEGCKFYLGSDAHALRAFEGMKENFQKITDLLELDDRHKFVPQP